MSDMTRKKQKESGKKRQKTNNFYQLIHSPNGSEWLGLDQAKIRNMQLYLGFLHGGEEPFRTEPADTRFLSVNMFFQMYMFFYLYSTKIYPEIFQKYV